MNTGLDFPPVASSIQEIVEQALCSGFLSLGQENQINELLFQRRYSEPDLEMLDCLTLALLNRRIEVEKSFVAKAA
ncbi:hypothetical protein [Synechococcus sp. H60.4]|uniref:hypothetical protein n=1 Tax=unclassified Synechococcus TaxID=2626047 RepID=UPI0039C098A8